MTPLELMQRRGLYTVIKTHRTEKKFIGKLNSANSSISAIDLLDELVKEINGEDDERQKEKRDRDIRKKIKQLNTDSRRKS